MTKRKNKKTKNDFLGKANAFIEKHSSILTVLLVAVSVLVVGSIAGFTADIPMSVSVVLPPSYTAPVTSPTVDIQLDKTSINIGQSTLLSWTSTNTTSCSATSDWEGTTPPIVNGDAITPFAGGSITVTPSTTGTKTYSINCIGAGGTAADSILLNVNSSGGPIIPPPPSPTPTPTPTPTPSPSPTPTPTPITEVIPVTVASPATPSGPSTPITFPTSPSSIRFILSTEKTSANADGIDTIRVTVLAVDENGRVIPGLKVSISEISGVSKNLFSIAPLTSVTDSQGKAYFTVSSSSDVSLSFNAVPIDQSRPYTTNKVTLRFTKTITTKPVIPGTLPLSTDTRPIAYLLGLLLLALLLQYFGDIIRFLSYLYSLLFGGAAKRPWGIVYDSETKEPVELSFVRIFDAKTKALKKTHVTNREGQFGFDVDKGNYYMVVTKSLYYFPSRLLKGALRDGKFKDLYFGKAFKVARSQTINYSIPVDNFHATKVGRSKLDYIRVIMDKISLPLLVIGLVVSAYILIISPIFLNVVIFALYIILLLLRVMILPESKPVSHVYDEKSGKNISDIAIQVFDAKYNKTLETKVTDPKGKLRLFLPKGKYYLGIASGQYRFSTKKSGKDAYSGQIMDLLKDQYLDLKIPLSKK